MHFVVNIEKWAYAHLSSFQNAFNLVCQHFLCFFQAFCATAFNNCGAGCAYNHTNKHFCHSFPPLLVCAILQEFACQFLAGLDN